MSKPSDAKAAPAAAAAGKGSAVPIASAAAGVVVREPTEKELEAENAILEAKIASLKDKLGITAAEEKEELARIKQVFTQFDRDNSGYIDKEEFELLAYQCGSDLNAISEENLAKTFASINPKGDGKLTFDQFYNWLKKGNDLKGEKGSNFGLLRLKLSSKKWLQRFDKPDAKSVAAAGGKAADAKAGTAAAGKDAKAAPADKKDMKMSNMALTLGKFGESKAGVYVTTGDDPLAAQQKRDETRCPDGVPTFVYIDLPLKDGFDEGQIGELAGTLEALIGAIPWQAIPLPVYHSHTVDVVDGEKPNTKSLRITVFSTIDLQDLAAGIMGQGQGGQPLRDAGSGSFKLELPFAVSDLKDPAFHFSADNLKFRLISEGDFDRRVLAASEDALSQMSPQRAWVQQMRLATAAFMKGFDLTLNFASLDDLVKHVPDFVETNGPAPVVDAQVARRGRRPPPRPRASPLQQLKAGLSSLSEMPVGAMLDSGLQQLPPLIAQSGQAALYEAFRNNVIGLGRIHVQSADYIFKVGLTGLDFAGLLPPLE